MTTHRFVSWLRFGAAAIRSDGATSGANPILTAQVTIDGATTPVRVTLHGPGDVAGLAASSISRREPASDALGVSPTLLPFVELRPADLPWRLSPAAGTGTVLPWLALVVVPAETSFGPRSGAPLLVLTVARGELPDPGAAWAWAHVQVEEPPGGIPGPIGAYVRDHAESAVARLLAPRQLLPNTKYRACVVPIYLAGCRAGLGQPVGDAGMTLAWDPSAPATAMIDLPVYDSWSFSTGEVADFETIGRRLHGADPDALFAPLSLDVSEAGGTTATMYGLLRPPDGDTALPDSAAIQTTLTPWLATDVSADPVVGPPLYGAAQTGVEKLGGVEPWQAMLNVDPRRRIQAAAGAAIVRADQEQLVADAYTAVGQLDRANAIVRGTQIATLVAQRVHARHVASRPARRIVSMLWPTLAGTPVAAAAAAPEAGATALLAPAMRRLARPLGPAARGRLAGLAWTRLGHDLTMRVTATTMATTKAVTLGGARGASPTVIAAARLAPARVAAISAGLATRERSAPRRIQIAPATPVDPAALATTALAATSPLGIAARLASRISGFAAVTTVSDLTEIRPTPDLSRPLADRLAQLRPEMFAPGLSDVPADTATVLTVDPSAIEAILAGANDELARELAWRGIALDRRTTLLRQLWARPARDPGPAWDVPPIASWTGDLGTHALLVPTVFVVRSELVRRFPTAIYACVRAVPDPKYGRVVGDEHLFPLFQGLAAPDIAYVAFAKPLAYLSGADDWQPGATTDPGWYFTIQERPGHTRFGLDATAAPGPLTAWDNLAWSDVDPDPYVPLATPSRVPATPPTWATSAASMAAIFERPAVRVALHVQELLAR